MYLNNVSEDFFAFYRESTGLLSMAPGPCQCGHNACQCGPCRCSSIDKQWK